MAAYYAQLVAPSRLASHARARVDCASIPSPPPCRLRGWARDVWPLFHADSEASGRSMAGSWTVAKTIALATQSTTPGCLDAAFHLPGRKLGSQPSFHIGTHNVDRQGQIGMTKME